jgi:hypothetical protein
MRNAAGLLLAGIAAVAALGAAELSAQDRAPWMDRYGTRETKNLRYEKRTADFFAVGDGAIHVAGVRAIGWPQLFVRAVQAGTIIELHVPLMDFAKWLDAAVDTLQTVDVSDSSRSGAVTVGTGPLMDFLTGRSMAAARVIEPNGRERLLLMIAERKRVAVELRMDREVFERILALLAKGGDIADELSLIDSSVPYRSMHERLQRLQPAPR